MKLLDRNAIVTGSSTGLGYCIALAFVKEGANVAICGRDATMLEKAAGQLRAAARSDQRIFAMPCDVGEAGQVEDFVRQAMASLGSIEILVNNAGVLGPIGNSEDVDVAEWRATIDTNLFGVLFSCRALIPYFRSKGFGRIINVSGGGAASPRPFFSAYATSKAAVVRLTENMAEELRGTGISVNAIAPGALNTRMLDQTLAAGRAKIGEQAFYLAARQTETGGSSMEKAAELCVYLAGEQSRGITGRLISAPWDQWPKLHEHLTDLESSDIYTLRRIIPADRAKVWN